MKVKQALLLVLLLGGTVSLYAQGAGGTYALQIETDGKVLLNLGDGRVVDLAEYLVPVGSIQAYAGSADSVPAGWVLCDGRSLSSSDARYARLYAVVGTAFGNGSTDGDSVPAAGNFNVPDFRGRFLRGAALGVGSRDPDAFVSGDVGERKTIQGTPATALFGGIQADALMMHRHGVSHDAVHQSGECGGGSKLSRAKGSAGITITDPTTSPNADQVKLSKHETRPVNVTVNFIIKL